MTYTTFEEWSKSKVWHMHLPVDNHEMMSGFVYADGAFIALTQMPPLGKPGWWSIIEKEEILDKSLNVVEAWLWFNWSKDNIENKMTHLRPQDMQINKGKYMYELEDPEYCPSSYSHKHEMSAERNYNEELVISCELCGVIES